MEDMDMDIPLPDELEWLENQYHEEADPFSYPPDEDEEEEEAKHEHLHAPFPVKPPAPVEVQSNGGHKRPISLQEDSAGPSNEKRSRIANNQDDEDDDDYLRYSPPPQESNDFEQPEISDPEEIIVSRFASRIDGEFIPVTAPGSGDRVYSKFCRIDPERETNQLSTSLRSKGLLFEPVHVLLQRCEQEAFSKCLRASSEDQSDIKISEAPRLFEKLWVDKYAPNSFTELLSDEQTNREVLLWLKQWDSCVFGSEIRTTGDEVLSALRRHSSIAHNTKRANANFLGRNRGQRWSQDGVSHPTNPELKENNSKWIQEPGNKNSRVIGPPEQKILLLCGPPGLGKTTLAHVAAKHCGYRVVEINASDDRSSSTVEAKILDVVQMNSVMADSKPKCLIIDEIDGALGDGKGAVEVILKMVAAERKFDGGKQDAVNEEQSGKNSKKKRRKTASLSRPVICICNDLYAPVLRPLRQIAKVHMFVQPSVSRVVSRLKHICNKEGMKTSSIALTSLAEYTECDIRACLNTLQFLNKRNQTLNVVDISSQVVGRKDISRNIFDIWKEIFQKRKSKRERNFQNSCSNRISSEFDVLHHLISSRGDYDLVLDGIHENILQQQYHDPKMQKTVACLNNVGVADLIHQYTMRSQKMNLLVYQPPLAISVHHLVAQVQRPNIEWPKSFQRYRISLMERMDSIRAWQNRVPPYISRHLSTKTFVEDLVSPLLHVLSPPNLRPVAMHLLTEKEKNDMTQLISRMVSYCITYKTLGPEPQPRSQRVEQTVDTFSLVFDPPIRDYISFKDYVPSHHVLALAMKQMLLHEVEKQKILQGGMERSAYVGESCNKEMNKDIAGADSGGTKSLTRKAGTYSKDSIEQRQNKGSSVPSNAIGGSRSTSAVAPTGATTTDLVVKANKNAKKLPTGFNYFDRFRKTNTAGSQSSSDIAKKAPTSVRDSHPVLFKFNEGFTNAIKRPARIRDFLL